MYHKDLEVYKKSVELVKEIYNITQNFPKEELFGLTSQLKRAVISIPSNIAEGSARYSDKDTSRFIDIAIGSLAEADTQIFLSKELNFISQKQYEKIEEIIDILQALLIGFKKYLKNKANKS